MLACSTDQSPARQRAAVGEVEENFTDHVSGGSRAERTALTTMLGHVRREDMVRVASMDRLACSAVDLVQLVTGGLCSRRHGPRRGSGLLPILGSSGVGAK